MDYDPTVPTTEIYHLRNGWKVCEHITHVTRLLRQCPQNIAMFHRKQLTQNTVIVGDMLYQITTIYRCVNISVRPDGVDFCEDPSPVNFESIPGRREIQASVYSHGKGVRYLITLDPI